MDHAFDAAEIDERAEVHDFHDSARHDVAFAQAVLQAFAILRGLLVQQLAAAQHEIAAVFAVFRHKERKGLADVFRGLLLHAARVHLRERAEAFHAGDLHAETAFAFRQHFAFNRNLVLEGLFHGAVNHVAAHLHGEFDAVVRPAHAERFDRVADFVFQLALVVFKVDAVDDAVHAGADIDENRAFADHGDGAFHLRAGPNRRRQLVQPAFHDVVKIFSVQFSHCFYLRLIRFLLFIMVGFLFFHRLGTVAIASSLPGSNGFAVASFSDAGKNQLLPRFATARPPGHVNS